MWIPGIIRNIVEDFRNAADRLHVERDVLPFILPISAKARHYKHFYRNSSRNFIVDSKPETLAIDVVIGSMLNYVHVAKAKSTIGVDK